MKVSTILCVALLQCLLRSSNSQRPFRPIRVQPAILPVFGYSCRRPRCETVLCASPQSLNCAFGVGSDQCNCCPYCLKGAGTPCAGANNREGNCAKGLVCIDENLIQIPDIRGPFTPVGECEKRSSGGGGGTFPPGNQCPNCAAVSCLRPDNCQFGTGLDSCGCCPVCLNGHGTPCAGPNNIEGNCGQGLVCIDARLNEIPRERRGPNTPIGECDRQSNGGTCPTPDCRTVRCGLPQNCEFGFGGDDCSCCQRCHKGRRETCAGPNNVEGNCADTLLCVDANRNTISPRRGQNTPVGKCILPRPTTVRPPPGSCAPQICPAVVCPVPICRHGIDDNECGCCPRCLKGRGEICGGPLNEAGVCRKRLHCVGANGRVIPPNGNRRNRTGRCRKSRGSQISRG